MQEIKAIVADYLPTGEIVGDNAGNLTVSISRSALRHVPNFLRQLNRDPDTLKEWGLSNSTLEEVFLRLATASKNVNEEVRVWRLARQHMHTQPHTATRTATHSPTPPGTAYHNTCLLHTTTPGDGLCRGGRG